MDAEHENNRDKRHPPEPRLRTRSGVLPWMRSIEGVRQHVLHRFFQLLYNELAGCYDLVAWAASQGRWRAWRRAALRHLAGKSVLELGHGSGHLLVELDHQGFVPVGLDASPFMARQAKRRLHSQAVHVPLVQARAQALPFLGEAFDSVVATFPTDFIIYPQTLREVVRVLRPRGRLVVVLGASFVGRGPISGLLRWVYRATGQEPASADLMIPQLERAGLSPRLISRRVDHTAVVLLIAERHVERGSA